jgi:hypothetical protein
MFTLLAFMCYGHPCAIEWYSPVYRRKGLSEVSCHYRGKELVRRAYEYKIEVVYVCVKERR